jgi:CubicO group peptidase (beta-lactamase class C family)
VGAGDTANLLREHAQRHSVPGAALGILRGGSVETAYYGVADLKTRELVSPATRFAIGSLTKSMVATAIARLVEARVLSLDDSVAAHVPELRATEWGERSTVRDLLANRSPFPLRHEFEFSGIEGTGDEILSRFAARVAAEPPTAVPWSYSNARWSLLGRALETLTGLVWEDALHTTLLAPAELDATTFATRPVAEPRASGHEPADDALVIVEPWTPRVFGPSGTTVLATAEDMLRFAALHVGDVALAALRRVHAEVHIYAWLDAWCLGWARFDWDGGASWGWDGLISGQRAVLRIVPERRGAVVLLTNSSTGRALYRSLFADLMEPLFGIRAPELELDASPGTAGDLLRFAGTYAWPDRRIDVRATDVSLVLEGARGSVEAHPINDRTFLVDAADPDTPTVTFGEFDEHGRPGVLYQMLWGLPRVSAQP